MPKMNPSDLTAFHEALLTAKAFLLKMHVRAAPLAIAGPNALADWPEYSAAIAALGSIEWRLAQAVAHAKDVAPALQDKLKSFAEKSPLALQAAEIAVNVQIADARRIDGQVVILARKTASVFSYFAGGGLVKKLFSKKSELPIRQMIVDIDRLLPFVDALQAASVATPAA
jgi:hypothetical protein